MKYKQQNQTKKFFELDAKNWSRKSNFKENLILNTIQERNYYVLTPIIPHPITVEVGCPHKFISCRDASDRDQNLLSLNA